jgi:hypothetical protein
MNAEFPKLSLLEEAGILPPGKQRALDRKDDLADAEANLRKLKGSFNSELGHVLAASGFRHGPILSHPAATLPCTMDWAFIKIDKNRLDDAKNSVSLLYHPIDCEVYDKQGTLIHVFSYPNALTSKALVESSKTIGNGKRVLFQGYPPRCRKILLWLPSSSNMGERLGVQSVSSMALRQLA